MIPVTRLRRERLDTLIVIGTSTGGPQALTVLMQKLPLMKNTVCCIVQHMPAGFTANLAKRLDQVSAWNVREAQDGDALTTGVAYVAPGAHQMRLAGGALKGLLEVAQTGLVNGHQPAVDVLFHSAIQQWPANLVGVILTGMGKDGSVGLKAIRDHGGYTVAEAESSCVVYGMPKAAAQLGAAIEVVPLPDVYEAVMRGCTRIGR